MRYSYDSPAPFTDISERYDELMDAPVQTIDGNHVSSLTLADRAYQHKWFGRQLQTQPARFGFLFRPDAPVEHYLGADANTVGHMYELGFHVAALMRAENIELPDEERGLLMFTVLGHDMDETTHDQIRHTCGGVTGDIACGQKTPADRALQVKIRQMRDRHLYLDIPRSTLGRVERIVSHQDTTVLGELYAAGHELQSLETTQVAEQTLRSGTFEDVDARSIEYVALNVRQQVLPQLVPHIGRFATIAARMTEFETTAA